MAKFKFGSKRPAGDMKSRAVIFFVVLIILVSLAVGYLLYRRHVGPGVPAGATLTGAPGIESIPGVGKTTTEYVKIQEQQNIRQAQLAAQQGTAAVPTITRVSYFGPSNFITQPGRPGCNPDELIRAREAGVTAEELRCKGCSPAALKAAGYTVGELAAAGFGPLDLKNAGFTPDQLRSAGFTADELKKAGFTPQQLAQAGYGPTARPTAGQMRRAGFNASYLKNAGYSPLDLKNAGFSAGALRNAGFSPNDLKNAGFTSGDLLRAGFSPNEALPQLAPPPECSIDALRQARAQGVSAAELKNRGCNAAAMIAAGYTPPELKAAGFTDNDLARAGITPFPPAAVGVTPFPPAPPPECSVEALRQARAQGVSAAALKNRGCNAAAMLAAGYTPAELKAAGYTDNDLARAGLTPAQIARVSGAPPGVSGGAIIPPVGNTELQLAQIQANQEKQLNEQQRQQRLAQVQSSMISQANSLFSTWTPPATQQFVAGEPPKEERLPVVQAPATVATATRVGTSAVTTAPVTESCAYVKGGDIMMGVLTSTVNSDENSPVMATIVSGKLRGAKLIGQFSLLKKKVLITFNKMNLPGKPASIGINAVAIDPATAHTALADCVNNHYWLRYGTLFASSFLSGLAEAIVQSGSQISTGSGGILVTHNRLNPAQTVAVALGAVGSQYASVLGSNFTRPPTVYVYAGNSIGVLFMQDLTEIPATCCPDIDKTCNGIGAAGLGGACCPPY